VVSRQVLRPGTVEIPKLLQPQDDIETPGASSQNDSVRLNVTVSTSWSDGCSTAQLPSGCEAAARLNMVLRRVHMPSAAARRDVRLSYAEPPLHQLHDRRMVEHL
jgi:hypothetical protein